MRLLFTATVQSHICQFHRYFITELRKQGHTVHVAARNNLAEKNGLQLDFADKVFDIPFDRSPFNLKRNLQAYRMLKKHLSKERYDVILCNTPVGGLLTRLVANKYRKAGTKVIYMAHGFHFCKGAPKKNWIFFYPVEKIMARFTDTLITINKHDYRLAQKKFHAKTVEYLPGIGIDLERFGNCSVDKSKKRDEIGVPKDAIWVLSVGELLPDKDHATVIRAIAQIQNAYYTIAGNGRLDTELIALAKELGIEDRFQLLGYRLDIPELCSSAEIFAFTSTFEGLPVALMEAMACEMDIVCTYARGNDDLIDDKKGGLKIQLHDYNALADAIEWLHSHDTSDMKEYNKQKLTVFSRENVVNEMMRIIYQTSKSI